MWISSETTLKAWRKIHSSKRKSLLSQNLPDSLERESVVDCDDQPLLTGYVNREEPPMAKTVEAPSASRSTGLYGALYGWYDGGNTVSRNLYNPRH